MRQKVRTRTKAHYFSYYLKHKHTYSEKQNHAGLQCFDIVCFAKLTSDIRHFNDFFFFKGTVTTTFVYQPVGVLVWHWFEMFHLNGNNRKTMSQVSQWEKMYSYIFLSVMDLFSFAYKLGIFLLSSVFNQQVSSVLSCFVTG